jgi:hypothetical protein
LATGKLKTKIETVLVKRATEEPNGIFRQKIAYQMAKKAIVDELEQKKHVESKDEKHRLP